MFAWKTYSFACTFTHVDPPCMQSCSARYIAYTRLHQVLPRSSHCAMLAVNILNIMCKFRPYTCISANICTMSVLPQLFSDFSVIKAYFRLFCACGLRHDTSTPLIHAMRWIHYIVLEQTSHLQHFDSKIKRDMTLCKDSNCALYIYA